MYSSVDELEYLENSLVYIKFTLYRIILTYIVTSLRDFVSARRIAFRDGAYYSCSKSVVTDLKPEQSGKVR